MRMCTPPGVTDRQRADSHCLLVLSVYEHTPAPQLRELDDLEPETPPGVCAVTQGDMEQHISRTTSSRRRAQRLSTDSSLTQSSSAYTSLPAYSQSTSRHSVSSSVYSDKPPDYHQSQSADEADLDDSDQEQDRDYFTRAPTSPFRKRQLAGTSRRTSPNQPTSSDPLDALLARSVHALEMSNVLLQSTMTTRSNLNASMAQDRLLDRNLELSAAVLNNRIRDTHDAQSGWMDDLHAVVRDVRDLYDDPSALSRSLPSGSTGSPHLLHGRLRSEPEPRNHRRRSSQSHADDCRPHLRLSSSPPRVGQYMSPPPRAMTQYVSVASEHGDAGESTADPSSIFMPSTIGLQSSSHLSSFRSILPQRRPDVLHLQHANSSTPGFIQYGRHASFSDPASWSANNHRRSRPHPGSPRSVGPSRSSFASSSPSRRGHHSASDSQRLHRSERSHHRPAFSPPLRRARSQSGSDGSVRGRSRSRSQTPKTHSRNESSNIHLHKPVMPAARTMTPPIEESPPEEQSSDSGPNVQRTLESLRKILGDAPRRERVNSLPVLQQRPSFLMPRTPNVTATAGTSTATATVSRLFTKGMHSTRDTPPSRPSLKLPNGSPRASPTLSAPSSGRSTPRQVAFAQLPEPYSAEGSRKGFDKSRSSKSKSKQSDKDKESPPGFWSLLFGAVVPPAGMHQPSARVEDRVEDRMSRSWARPGGQSTLEDYLY
ncbi:hypothetical protein BKA62DRAFT_690243, partial [Auriculariales sp. MPI-PUGE-AT-0066]